MYSHWEKKHWFSDVEYTIVGSGIVGLFTAIFLKGLYPKASIRILDSHAIPQGASTKNAGFACFGSVGEILDDLVSISEEEVTETIALRYRGLALMKETIDPKLYAYRNCGGSEVFLTKDEFELHADNLDVVNSICKNAIGAIPFEIQKNVGFKTYQSLIHNHLEGQLNPVLLIRALLQRAHALGVDVCLGHKVSDIEEDNQSNVITLDESSLSFKSKQVIVTNNAFATHLLSGLDLVPARNQVVVTKPLKTGIPEGTYHFDKGYIYFRNVGTNQILIGGARNLDPNTERTDAFESNSTILNHLVEFCEKYIVAESIEIETQWSGIMGLGQSKRPLVKELRPGLRVGVRLGGMGIAIGAAVAHSLCYDF